MKSLLGASSAAAAIFRLALCADFVPKARKAASRPASRRGGSFGNSRCAAGSPGPLIAQIYLRLRAALLDRGVRAFERDFEVRFVRDAVRARRIGERAVVLRRLERAVLRDGLRRLVAVLRRLVDLAVDLRAVALRDDLRADDLRADDLRVVLRLAVLRLVVLRPDVFSPDVLRPEDAAVLPALSRRFVRARLRLFFAGVS
jgi:hypothetical protein